jgi:hypothetical protein
MRTQNSFLLGGALLVAFALACFLYVTVAPDNDAPRGILFFGTTLFPTLMGLALLVTGFASGLFGRATWDRPSAA